MRYISDKLHCGKGKSNEFDTLPTEKDKYSYDTIHLTKKGIVMREVVSIVNFIVYHSSIF
jgi:hypothetical protein